MYTYIRDYENMIQQCFKMFRIHTLISSVIITSVLCSPHQYQEQQLSSNYSGQSRHHHIPSQQQGSIRYSNHSRPYNYPYQHQESIHYPHGNSYDTEVRPQSRITYGRQVRDLGFYRSDCTAPVQAGKLLCRAEILVYTWDNANQQCTGAFTVDAIKQGTILGHYRSVRE